MLKAHRLTILLAFTFSGCTGLIYEAVWSHYLGLYLGHAAYAQTLTLAIFMGGMTVGAYLVSRRIERIRNALLGYALMELILGVAGLIFHNAYTGLVASSYDVVFPALGDPGLINFYKWASAALLILPQSILLGCTFPLLCSALIRREQEGIGKHISILYFTNSIGAAAGALVATFLLIPNMGMPGAMLVSGVANIAIAVAVYLIAKNPEPAGDSDSPEDPSAFGRLTQIALIAALLTGAVSFMYEIAWIRMLNLVLGTSLHAFEIMLSAFIAGIALGGLWIRSRIDRIPDLLRFAGLVQIVMGMAAISTLILYHQSFTWVATLLNETLQRTDTGYFFYNLATSLISGLIMIPATFCAGMTLPLLTTHLVRHGHNENAIGRVYASNTIGAIIGIVIAVHLGLTLLGLKWLIVAAGLIDVALGVFLIVYTGKTIRDISLRFRLGASAIGVLVALSLVTELSPSRLSSGTYRYARSEVPNEIHYYRDGKTASISVTKKDDLATIYTNGKPDASLRIAVTENGHMGLSDEVTMGMLGSMAMLVDPQVSRVANIGFGSGLTSQVALSNPEIEILDSIEIEPFMIEAARLFKQRNYLAYDDPRSQIHYEDAKTFFAANQQKYNAIISVPSNPWVIGVGNLFSLEFYDHLKRYLEDDGILVQWLQLYEISLPTLMTALNSLNSSFGKYDLYVANNADLVIVATPDGATDLSIKARWEQLPDGLRRELEMIGLSSIDDLKSRKLLSKNELEPFIWATSPSANSDYFPLLSLNAPRDRFKSANARELFEMPMLGMVDNPFRIEALSNAGFYPDRFHLFADRIRLTRSYADVLLRGRSLVELGFEDQALVGALTGYREFCASPETRKNWVVAFHQIATHANNFGSPELRDAIMSLAGGFDCIGDSDSEKGTRALYRALMLSLDNFTAQSSAALLQIIGDMQQSNMPAAFRSFVISSYLSSLIKHPATLDQSHIETISLLRPQFDMRNRWLEALLSQKVLQGSQGSAGS